MNLTWSCMLLVSHSLHLMWTAAAVHRPALLANEWGHKSLLVLLRDTDMGLCSTSFYTAQQVVVTFTAFRLVARRPLLPI